MALSEGSIRWLFGKRLLLQHPGKIMFKRFFFVSLLLLTTSWAFGQARPKVAFPPSFNNNSVTFGPVTADAANAAAFAFGAAANGSIFANSAGYAPTPGGSSIPITVAGTIPPVSAARALGRFALRTLPLLNTGIALYDLALELGFTASNKADMSAQFTRLSKAYTYNFSPSQDSSCAAWSGTSGQQAGVGCTAVPNEDQGYPAMCLVKPGTTTPWTCTPRTDSTQVTPATNQDFVDAVAAKSGWSPSSAIGRAVKDAISVGESVDVNPQAVTGPASSPVNQAVVNNGTTTSTAITTNNYSYSGPTITTTSSTVTSTINNADGLPVGQPTIKTDSAAINAPVTPEKLDIETCGLPGKPKCLIDETGTPTYDAKKLELDKATLEAAATSQRDKVSAGSDKTSIFQGFSQFFSLPPLAACTPVVMPSIAGQQIASMDVCPGAEWLRGLMGFVWAVAGFLFVFRTVEDVI